MAKRLQSVDLMKTLACIFIMCIHIMPLESINQNVSFFFSQGLPRLAVPFFFSCSSYLFFKSGANTSKYCIRMIKYYLFWFVVCLPSAVYYHFIIQTGPLLQRILLFLHKALVASTFQGSWFIISCIVCACICSKIPKNKLLGIFIELFAAFCFLMDCLGSGYNKYSSFFEPVYNIYKTFTVQPSNNIFCGLPFFLIGKIIFDHEDKIKIYKSWKWGLLLIILLPIVLGEVYILYINNICTSTDCIISIIPGCIICMNLALINGNKQYVKCEWLLRLFRIFPTISYPLHLLLLFFINGLSKYVHIEINSVVKFMMILFACLLCSLFIVFTDKKHKMKMLKLSY